MRGIKLRLTNLNLIDEYENFEVEFNWQDRRYRRRQGRPTRGRNHTTETISQLTDFSDNAIDFVPSYAAALDPLHFERQWIINSLGGFYQDNLITDVTRMVKGGKEANVYCCPANPATGVDLIAAKLYRPRMLRHLRNDAMYKEGRLLLDDNGDAPRFAEKNSLWQAPGLHELDRLRISGADPTL
jgi:RIO kinase 1